MCLCGAATPCSSSCLFMLEEATWHTTAASQMHCRNGLTACVCVCESGCDPRPKCSGSECHYVTSVIWCLSTGDQDVNVSRFVPSVKTICQTDQRPENPNTRKGSLLKLFFFFLCKVGVSTMYLFRATFSSCSGNEAHPEYVTSPDQGQVCC